VGLPAGHADFWGHRASTAQKKTFGASGKGNEYITTVVPGNALLGQAVHQTDPPIWILNHLGPAPPEWNLTSRRRAH